LCKFFFPGNSFFRTGGLLFLEHLDLRDTQIVVVDEADTLFGVEVYRQQTMHIFFLCRSVRTFFFCFCIVSIPGTKFPRVPGFPTWLPDFLGFLDLWFPSPKFPASDFLFPAASGF
jgi:hypothetical protein